MLLSDLEEALESWSNEIDAELRRIVRVAEQTQTINLDRYRMLGSLETLLIAADATCTSLLRLEEEGRVPV